MWTKSTVNKREQREQRAPSMLVPPSVVADLLHRLENRTTALDFTNTQAASSFGLPPQVGRAD